MLSIPGMTEWPSSEKTHHLSLPYTPLAQGPSSVNIRTVISIAVIKNGLSSQVMHTMISTSYIMKYKHSSEKYRYKHFMKNQVCEQGTLTFD